MKTAPCLVALLTSLPPCLSLSPRNYEYCFPAYHHLPYLLCVRASERRASERGGRAKEERVARIPRPSVPLTKQWLPNEAHASEEPPKGGRLWSEFSLGVFWQIYVFYDGGDRDRRQFRRE